MRLDETGVAEDVQALLVLVAKVVAGTLDEVVLDDTFDRPPDTNIAGICADEQVSAEVDEACGTRFNFCVEETGR